MLRHFHMASCDSRFDPVAILPICGNTRALPTFGFIFNCALRTWHLARSGSWWTAGAGGIEQHHRRDAKCEQPNEPCGIDCRLGLARIHFDVSLFMFSVQLRYLSRYFPDEPRAT